MSMAALRWARGVRGITSTQKLVLWALADMANDYAEAWPSATALAVDCCLSERAVRSAFADLEARGLIAGDHAYGRSTRWRLRIDEAPEQKSATPERGAATPEPRSGVAGAERTGQDTPERRAPTPERGSAPPRNVVHPPRNVVHTEPSITPIEPTGTPKPRAKTPTVKVVLPDWLPPDAWRAWCEHRIGAAPRKWTQRAAELTIRKLGDLRDQGHDPQAVIDQSIMAGWSGLFAVKDDRASARQRDGMGDVLRRMAAQRQKHYGPRSGIGEALRQMGPGMDASPADETPVVEGEAEELPL
jgi:hypothetical protein